MKDLRPIKGTFYIHRLIAEGEHEQQDFKFAISDARKIARTISAFANNRGGRLLIGVKDNGAIAGVRNDEDIFVVEEAATRYCRPQQPMEATAFAVDGGLVVVRVTIAAADVRPVEVSEADGSSRAYFRVADENIAVPHFISDAWKAGSGEDDTVVSLSGPELTLAGMLDNHDAFTFDMAMRALHVTAATAVRTIARLYRLGLLTFEYHRDGFVIRKANASPQGF